MKLTHLLIAGMLLVGQTVFTTDRLYYPCQGRGQHRSAAQRQSFIKQHPCPAGPDKGSTKRCRGYEVDHIIPLACCGIDAAPNMQWLTKEQNRLKGAKQCRM